MNFSISGIKQLLLALMISGIASNAIFSTTIIPFTNLGHLSKHSDQVVMARVVDNFDHFEGDQVYYRSRLKVMESIKGTLSTGQSFEIQKWEMRVGEMVRKMYGDIELEKGHTYLLFLNDQGKNRFHPICFSYYIFEERIVEDQSLLVPSGVEEEFILVGDRKTEPLFIFKKKELINHLHEVTMGSESWSKEGLLADHDFVREHLHHLRAAPSHCSFLSSGSNFRWLDLPTAPLPVYYASGGDGVCTGIPGFIGSAINNLNQQYQGINLVNGGTFSGFTPTCGSAHGSSFRDYVLNTFGDNRRTLIQFNDPCNELPNLQSCSGTLAVGGLFGIGSHSYQGETWFSGAYGYVVVNNGVGSCFCGEDDYRNLMVHELSHTMGLGHIGSSHGVANMNPFCCNSIQSLDQECMNYSYDSSGGIFLPVELSRFWGEPLYHSNNVSWMTASEQNVEKFVIERSDVSTIGKFYAVGQVLAIGNSTQPRSYAYSDINPDPSNYYRLKVIDFDGAVQYSEILNIKRSHTMEILLYPTDVLHELYIRLPTEAEDAQVSITDPGGKLWISTEITGEVNRLPVNSLISGIYLVTIIESSVPKTFRIRKI